MKKPKHPTNREMVKAAQELCHEEGILEIDDYAHGSVSRADGNPDNGAYVKAWVWIDDKDVPGYEAVE